jgi:hypothetical protein
MGKEKPKDDEAKDLSRKTKTDYTEKEETLDNSAATNYEEPLKESLHTADTSVDALKEVAKNPEEDPDLAKKVNPKEGLQE